MRGLLKGGKGKLGQPLVWELSGEFEVCRPIFPRQTQPTKFLLMTFSDNTLWMW